MILRFPFGPVLLYAIPDVVTGYFRLRKGDDEITVLRQQNTEGRKGAVVPEVVVGCVYLDPAATASREGAKLHGGFGIHGDAQNFLSRVGFTVDFTKLIKNGVRFRDFFQRFVFLTFRSR